MAFGKIDIINTISFPEMAALQKQRMLEDIDLHGYSETSTYSGIQWKIHHPDGTYICGYVTLPDADKKLLDHLEQFTHGGWTFSDDTAGIYGFDCAHGGDYRGMYIYRPGEVYRDRDYVFACIKKIIDAYRERYPETIFN